MKLIEIILYTVLVISLIIIFYFLYKTGKPVKNAFYLISVSLMALAIINLTSPFSGVRVPINPYSVTATAVYGLPGIAGIIFLCTIFGI
ncbi:MAG: pro-sigmaK processing inhibitor BofA family protein [Clostridia bacterium]|nr:pro-sigmaK processing inhibitor BofA family protein [Clostridia bacterium]